IRKEMSRGSAAAALLPSKENLGEMQLGIIARIDEVIAEAKNNGSLQTALNGLNSIRHTVNDLARLAGHLQTAGAQVNVSVQNNVGLSVAEISERLIRKYDHDAQRKAEIAQTLLEVDNEHRST